MANTNLLIKMRAQLIMSIPPRATNIVQQTEAVLFYLERNFFIVCGV